MIHAQSHSLHASPFARTFPAFAAPPVDRETALALRRTTASSPVARQARKGRRLPRALAALAQSPLICTLPPEAEAETEAPKSSVPVVIVPSVPVAPKAAPETALQAAPKAAAQAERPRTLSLRARVQLDLSWMVAILVALFVTLALAIPLELFRQNG